MTLHRFAFPTPIVFGAGARREIAKHLLAAGVKRPLVVTDEGLAKLPVLQQLTDELGDLEFVVFSGIKPVPPEDVGVAPVIERQLRREGLIASGASIRGSAARPSAPSGVTIEAAPIPPNVEPLPIPPWRTMGTR